MKTISATDAARGFAELLNRVRYQGEHYEVIRNGERIARIVPTAPVRAMTAAELAELLRNLPPLDEGFQDELRSRSAASWERSREWER